MSLTVAQAEAILIRRRGPAMVACDLDGTGSSTWSPAADTSPRAYLADPLAKAFRTLGFQAADPLAPVDADLATLVFTEIDPFLDVAELRLLETCIGNYPDVDYTEGGSAGRKLQQLREDLQKQLDWKRKQVLADYPRLSLPLGSIPEA
jgi:hypothetical protein